MGVTKTTFIRPSRCFYVVVFFFGNINCTSYLLNIALTFDKSHHKLVVVATAVECVSKDLRVTLLKHKLEIAHTKVSPPW